jgi:transposase
MELVTKPFTRKTQAKSTMNRKTEIQALKLQLAQLRKMIYGSRQEKFVPQSTSDQLSLELPLEPTPPVATHTQKISYERTTTKSVPSPSNHPGRYKLPEHLERRIIEITPEVTESMVKIGEEITEELELEPGRLYVNRYIRPKYIDKQSEQITIAPMVDRPLPKAIVGAGLLTQMMIDKYVDHLPIHRICERFKREKVNIPYNTMVD